jgi:O-antigen/teichoic acid export membrane protein
MDMTARSSDPALHELGALATRGIVALVSRTLVQQVVVFAGSIALMRLLTPRDFGAFAIVQSVLAIVALFGDTGVGGALVRQGHAPTSRQLSSVFYFQAGASVALMAAVGGTADTLPRLWPDLPASATLLAQVMAIDFVLVSLRIAPMLILERGLRFRTISAIDVAGSLAFYGVAVSLALSGAGVWSLAGAVLVRGSLITGAAFAVSGWRPSTVFAWAELRPLLRFGLAQQSRNVISLVNDAVMPFWGGRVLGITAVGYLNWARQAAYFPLKMVDTLRTVGFPLFAKLQHDRALVGEALGRAIHLCAFVTCGFVALFVGLGEPLTRHLFSEQWLPAVPLLAVFSGAISIGFLSPLVASAFDAIGRPGVFARVALLWTAINWVAVPIGTTYGGTLGFAIGYASHVVIGNVVIAEVLRRILPEARFWRRIRVPLLAASVAAAAGRFVLLPYATQPFGLAAAASAAVGLYTGLVALFDRRALLLSLTIVPQESRRASEPQEAVALV